MPVPRKRSCAQCRTAKTRCSLTAPKCTRCDLRFLGCDYSEALPRATSAGPVRSSSNCLVRDSSCPPAEGTMKERSDDLALSSLIAIDTSDFQMDAIDWAGPDADVANHPFKDDASWFQYSFTGQNASTEYQVPCISTPAMDSPETRSDEAAGTYIQELSRKVLISDLALQPWPSPQLIPEKLQSLLDRRPIENVGSSLIVNYLLREINTFPEMLSTPPILPPFIVRNPFFVPHQNSRRSLQVLA
jgi:hypothetical protein